MVSVRGYPLTCKEGDGAAPGPLPRGTWTAHGGRLYSCWDLEKGAIEPAAAVA